VTAEMRATEQYFIVLLFIVLYRVVLAFDSVYAIVIVKCDDSNESCREVLSCDFFIMLCNTAHSFVSMDEILKR